MNDQRTNISISTASPRLCERHEATLDDDGGGTITREELDEGFKKMKVTLNTKMLTNLFVMLDRNCDNEISTQEFADVFDKHLGPEGAKMEEPTPSVTATAKSECAQEASELDA